MTLYKLKAVSTILIEDNYNVNILPLVSELSDKTDCSLKIVCYEQPLNVWQNVFKGKSVQCLQRFQKEKCTLTINNSKKLIYIINSVNQMVLDMGWNECLKNLRELQNSPNITNLIIILHRDSLSSVSRLHINLNHIANAIVTYDSTNLRKVLITIKKNGKIFKSEEMLSYDFKTSTLKLSPIIKVDKVVEVPEKNIPSNLSTFKIETDQTQQLEKHKLKLPYMNKIKEGQGKVFYEPDAVDDWDDEDPDDDLDI